MRDRRSPRSLRASKRQHSSSFCLIHITLLGRFLARRGLLHSSRYTSAASTNFEAGGDPSRGQSRGVWQGPSREALLVPFYRVRMKTASTPETQYPQPRKSSHGMALVSRGDEKSVPSKRDEGHPMRIVRGGILLREAGELLYETRAHPRIEPQATTARSSCGASLRRIVSCLPRCRWAACSATALAM